MLSIMWYVSFNFTHNFLFVFLIKNASVFLQEISKDLVYFTSLGVFQVQDYVYSLYTQSISNNNIVLVTWLFLFIVYMSCDSAQSLM